MSFCLPPQNVPSTWTIIKSPDGDKAAIRTFPDGLKVIVSHEYFDKDNTDSPPMGPGDYLHISLSRTNKYPHWNEMRELIYNSCVSEWIDKKKDVVMLLPPLEQYVNLHPNCFHFYQKKG